MSVSSNTPDIGHKLTRALTGFHLHGLPFVATPAATRLEHDLGAAPESDARLDGDPRIAHLEGDGLLTRALSGARDHRARYPIRYFLDGVQRTLPIGWCGMNALALVVVVAGVIERRPQDGVFRAVPGLVTTRAAVLIAHAGDDCHTERLYDGFHVAGLAPRLCGGDPPGALRDGDYLALQSCLRPAVNTLREECEVRVYTDWASKTDGSEGWLIVDGSLPRGDYGYSLGLIKRHSRFDLTNAEMTALLAMPVGHRSSAFRRGVTGGPKPTTWYLRFHQAAGADPLFGLARVEAPASIAETDRIDLLSDALFAERTPRATSDERWPTLLYPIHIAERIFKVKLERAMLGVPAALRRSLREVA